MQISRSGGYGIVREPPLKGHCRKESEKAAGLWMDVRRIARGNTHIQIWNIFSIVRICMQKSTFQACSEILINQ